MDGLRLLLNRGPADAMNLLNRRETTMIQTNRNYKATFILDNRGKEDSVEQIDRRREERNRRRAG